MPLFMTETKFTETSLSVLANRPSNRPESVAKVIEAHGGKLLQFYWVFGEVDVVLIYEVGHSEDAMAILFKLSSGGAISYHKTTALLSNEEGMAAMQNAGTVPNDFISPCQEWQGWRDDGGEG